MKAYIAAMVGLAALASSASAQQFALTGAEIGAAYSSTEMEGDSGNYSTVFGSAAFSVAPNFGIQAGVSQRMFASVDITAANLHIYYALPSGSKLGTFASHEKTSGSSTTINTYGFEGMFSIGPANIEVRSGRAEISGSGLIIDFTGSNISYPMMSNLDVTVATKYVHVGGLFDSTELLLGADYYVTDNIRIGASAGPLWISDGGAVVSGTSARVEFSYLFGGRGQHLFHNQDPLDTVISLGF